MKNYYLKNDLVIVGIVLGLIAFSIGLGCGIASITYMLTNKHLENVGIEVVETTNLGRPTKVVDLDGDTCVVVPKSSFVKVK